MVMADDGSKRQHAMATLQPLLNELTTTEIIQLTMKLAEESAKKSKRETKRRKTEITRSREIAPSQKWSNNLQQRRLSPRTTTTQPVDDLNDSEAQSDILPHQTRLVSIPCQSNAFDEDLFRPKTILQPGYRRVPEAPFVAADDISEEYIAKIARRVVYKEYSVDGTSCHQCRQKTTDSKTYCRSGRCIGVRGQFCGVCLKNRYGEDAAVALRDPNWACPPCRNLCNCSVCRNRQGKMPTGMLAPAVQNQGFKSVAEFLEHRKVDEQRNDEQENADAEIKLEIQENPLEIDNESCAPPNTDDKEEFVLS